VKRKAQIASAKNHYTETVVYYNIKLLKLINETYTKAFKCAHYMYGKSTMTRIATKVDVESLGIKHFKPFNNNTDPDIINEICYNG
jgi:hypothetical protein